MVAVAICLAGITMFSGCDTEPVPDPPGTIALLMRLEDGSGATNIEVRDMTTDVFCIDKDVNFTGKSWWCDERRQQIPFYQFAYLGEVDGLGSIQYEMIKDIPPSGWASKVAVIEGAGYVIEYKSTGEYKNFYMRLYVERYINNNGKIWGAVVKYQYPFGQHPFVP